MNSVFLAYTIGDPSFIIGVGTDMEQARKIIKSYAKKRNITIKELSNNKFLRVDAHDGEADHFWIEEEKVNKPF